jgi:integrase
MFGCSLKIRWICNAFQKRSVKMATVFIQKRKRKNRNSYVIYYKDSDTGKNKYYKTLQKQKEAQQAANDLRTLLNMGKLLEIRKDKKKLRPLTFAEVAQHREKEWNEKLANRELVETTFKDYTLRLRSTVNEFGTKLMLEISRQEILEYRNGLAVSISNATSNRYLFIVKQVFKTALILRAIPENPVFDIQYLSEKEHERNKFILPIDIDRLVKASQKTRAKFYIPALILLGAEHGASRQEALSLQWKDIIFDFDGIGLIRFFRSKNKKERTEFLMPRTRQALLDWKDHLEWMRHRKKIKVEDDRFVFCRQDGAPIKRFDSAWNRICDITGIKDFHYHDLRHTFCSNLLLSGSGLKDVKEMIGHKDISMTDRYSHLPGQHRKYRQEQLAEHYANGS